MLQRFLFLVPGLLLAGSLATISAAEQKPLRALLITSGCCHNYPLQTQQLTNAVAKLTSAEWTVVKEK